MIAGSIAWWYRGNTASTDFSVEPAAFVDKSACTGGVVASKSSACARAVGFAQIRMVVHDVDSLQNSKHSRKFDIQSALLRICCRQRGRQREREREREGEGESEGESEVESVDAFVVDDARGVLLAAAAGRLVVVNTAILDDLDGDAKTTPQVPHIVVDYFPTPHSMVLSSDGRMLVTGHTTCARVWSTACLMQQNARTATHHPPKCLRVCYNNMSGGGGSSGGGIDCGTYVYVSCAPLSASYFAEKQTAETRTAETGKTFDAAETAKTAKTANTVQTAKTANTVQTVDAAKTAADLMDLMVWTSGHMYATVLRAWVVRLGSCESDIPFLVDVEPEAALQAHRYSTQTCFAEGPQVLVYGPQLCCDPLVQ